VCFLDDKFHTHFAKVLSFSEHLPTRKEGPCGKPLFSSLRNDPGLVASQRGQNSVRHPRIYPNFSFAVERNEKGSRITDLETKGDQRDN
jgi:hypothetical protein